MICERRICTGCGLCSNVCPKSAISMEESDDTGHYIPKINEDICTDCGICAKYCPSLKSPKRNKTIKTYAAWLIDDEKRKGSSSGGIAAAFYENAASMGYKLVGTYLDESFRARMGCVENLIDSYKFKGSKYLQAKSDQVYTDCMNFLKNNQKVLFIGTPCQCAAMTSVAEDKYKENLVTVELICHGTPSHKLFREYINTIEVSKNKRATDISFRSDWGAELSLIDGKKSFWKYRSNEDDYLVAFHGGILLNECCYICKYANEDRCSDITIGDFWGIGVNKPFNKPDCRVSVIVVNSKKGEGFLNSCTRIYLEERDYAEAKNGNPSLVRPSKKHIMYDDFWKEYHNRGIKFAFKLTFGPKLRKRRFKNKIVRGIKEKIKFILRNITRM